jgi:uncharacterized protein (UPF0333 family)
MMRTLSFLVVLLAAGIIAYTWGKHKGQEENRTDIIQNYTFVKDIAELASLEVQGTTTFNSTNIPKEEKGVLSSWQAYFFENTVSMTVPFTAKYGMDLSKDSLKLQRINDTAVRIVLPRPKLLSYELHLDRLEANGKKGLFSPTDEAFRQGLQKKLYTQSRSTLVANNLYLNRAQDRVCKILSDYYKTLGATTVCVFKGADRVLN